MSGSIAPHSTNRRALPVYSRTMPVADAVHAKPMSSNGGGRRFEESSLTDCLVFATGHVLERMLVHDVPGIELDVQPVEPRRAGVDDALGFSSEFRTELPIFSIFPVLRLSQRDSCARQFALEGV